MRDREFGLQVDLAVGEFGLRMGDGHLLPLRCSLAIRAEAAFLQRKSEEDVEQEQVELICVEDRTRRHVDTSIYLYFSS